LAVAVAVFAPFAEERAARGEVLDAVVVRSKNPTISRSAHAPGVNELAVPRPVRAPNAEETPARGEILEAVVGAVDNVYSRVSR
jgi:hypothetical protein